MKQFFKYVLLSVTGTLGISVYILADTYFIALYCGAEGLATLNLILPLYSLIFAIGGMIGVGSATLYAIRKATGADTSLIFGQAILWVSTFSLPFVLTGIFFPEQVLTLLGADESLLVLGTPYIRIGIIAAPLFMINSCVTSFVRNDAAPMTTMAGALVGSSFNILFDYIFMFVMDMGLTGAALATAISPAVTSAVCLSHFFSRKNKIVLKWSPWSTAHLRRACSLGSSAFMSEISAMVITFTFNMLILSLGGNTGVAAYGVIANIAIVVMAIFNGISQGTQPLISDSYGRGNTRMQHFYVKMSLAFSFALSMLIVIAVFTKSGFVIGIFNSQNDVALSAYAKEGIRFYFPGFPIAALNIMLVSSYAASDRGKKAFVCSLLRGLVGIIFFAVVLSRFLGMQGIWLSFPAAEVLTLLFILLSGAGRDSSATEKAT